MNEIQMPKYLIYLKCDVETAMIRLKKRGRNMEQEIPVEYLQKIKAIDENYDPSQLIIEGTMLLEEYRPLSSIQENSQTDVWENNSSQLVIYNFNGIENIEIEADEGTDLMMYRQTTYDPSTDSYQVDKIGTRIRIGPTNKYVLKPLENEVTDLYFLLPSYAIINYKAISSIEVKGLQT